MVALEISYALNGNMSHNDDGLGESFRAVIILIARSKKVIKRGQLSVTIKLNQNRASIAYKYAF